MKVAATAMAQSVSITFCGPRLDVSSERMGRSRSLPIAVPTVLRSGVAEICSAAETASEMVNRVMQHQRLGAGSVHRSFKPEGREDLTAEKEAGRPGSTVTHGGNRVFPE